MSESGFLEYLLTYGWMVLVVVIVGASVWASANGENTASKMPANFSYSESKDAVSQVTPGVCVSDTNSTGSDRYGFDCCKVVDGYRYCVDASVEFNESGADTVRLYN